MDNHPNRMINKGITKQKPFILSPPIVKAFSIQDYYSIGGKEIAGGGGDKKGIKQWVSA